EVAVTFIAEGGAVLLREKQASLDDIHPVTDVGLDDIASGVARRKDLAAALDKALGTRLADIVRFDDGGATLTRKMRFEEGIAGTALMYAYEKDLAAQKLGADIGALTLDQQFVAASLVYNSGLVFTSTSRAHIEKLATADELHD